MSRTQAETVIKNIIREIVQECSTKGQVVSETLVAFIVGFGRDERSEQSYQFEAYIFDTRSSQ
jgi:hypothetical protein